MTEGSVNTWYIASCESVNDDGTYTMNHLTRVKQDCNLTRKHPPRVDSLNLHPDSILDCKISGEWDVSNQRIVTFRLKNHADISSTVEQISENINDS